MNQGLSPLPKDSISKEYLSSSACKDCHTKEHREWENSMHKKSFTNRFFMSAFSTENKNWCINCHTPLYEQYQNFFETSTGSMVQQKGNIDILKEGINCAVCHVREDTIYTSTFPNVSTFLKSPHKLSYDPFLKDPKFCAGCHDFPFPEHFSPITFSGVPMQSTYKEWSESGEKRTCQNCHFSRGNHSLPGPHTKDFISSSMEINFQVNSAPMNTYSLYIHLSFPKIGHNFITGDLFRAVSISIYDKEKKLIRVHFINKNVKISTKEIVQDTTLKKRNEKGHLEEVIHVHIGRRFPTFCKMEYHFQGKIERELEREHFSQNELKYLLYEGDCGKLEK